MEITKNTVESLLKKFRIEDEIESFQCLVNIDYLFQKERIIKYYSRVRTCCESYVLKILRLPMCPDLILEKQEEISQLYRSAGIPTPRCYESAENKYCIRVWIDDVDVVLVLEEDAGEIVHIFSEQIAEQAAVLLGKMHRISVENGWRFRKGSFYREFCAGRTSYLSLWKDTGTEFLPQKLLKEIIEKYDKHLENMKAVWMTLPTALVQGDFYRLNWTEKEGQLTIIDYDRAGDEVLLTDFLITWFRMKYDPVIQQKFPEINRKEMFEKFLAAYESERLFTQVEKAAFSDAYAVLGAVYGTRYLISYAVKKDFSVVEQGMTEILEMLR